jgi:hypothetical protein
MSVTALASDEIYNKEIAEATSKIEASPQNPDSYTQRMNVYDKAGKYKEAAADLAKQCGLTKDIAVKELCEAEVTDYRKARGL